MDSIMFKFPDGTKERIKNLAQPFEPMTNVVLRALDALEQSITVNTNQAITVNSGIDNGNIDTSISVKPIDVEQLHAQITALNERLTAIETAGATQHHAPAKTAPRGELEPVPSDRRLLAQWATVQHDHGHEWQAIHAAIADAGHNVGKNASRARFMPTLEQWASEPVGGLIEPPAG